MTRKGLHELLGKIAFRFAGMNYSDLTQLGYLMGNEYHYLDGCAGRA